MSETASPLEPSADADRIAQLLAEATSASADRPGISHALSTLANQLSLQHLDDLAARAQDAAVSVAQAAVDAGATDATALTWLAECRHTLAQRLVDAGRREQAAAQTIAAVPAYQRAAAAPGAAVIGIARNLTSLQKLMLSLGLASEGFATQRTAVAVLEAYSPPAAWRADYDALLSDLLVTLAARCDDAGQPDAAGAARDLATLAAFQWGLALWNRVAEPVARIASHARALAALGATDASSALLSFSSRALRGIEVVELDAPQQHVLDDDSHDVEQINARIAAAVAAARAAADARQQIPQALAALGTTAGAPVGSAAAGVRDQAQRALQRFGASGVQNTEALGRLIAAATGDGTLGSLLPSHLDGGLGHDPHDAQTAIAALLARRRRFCAVRDFPIPSLSEIGPLGGVGPDAAARWAHGGLTVAIDGSGARFAPFVDPAGRDAVDIVTSAFLQWQAAGLVGAAGYLDFQIVDGAGPSDISVSFVDSDVEPSFVGSVVGSTTTRLSGTVIVRGRIRLSARAEWSVGLLQAVVLHEIGDVLGLLHDHGPGSLMNPVGGRVRAIDDPAITALRRHYT